GIWSEDQNEARALRMKIGQYVMEEGVLFKKSYLMPMLRCVGPLQANYVIREIHKGACNMYLKARSVVAKAIRKGTAPRSPRESKIHNRSRRVFYKVDRGQTAGQNDEEGGEKVCVGQYCLQANSLVERANRSLLEGIKTRLGRERKGWVDELPSVLWAHRISLKTSNGETPYGLTFEREEVILAEIGMPTHRTMMIKEGECNEEEMRLNLDLLTERKEAASIWEARYEMKMEQYYNKKVRHVSFKVGEYVYWKNEASRVVILGKLGPKWKGPYLVVEAYQNGSYKLWTMDDREAAPRVKGETIF
nr:reverse transcriptase domain-containing protein [Tanacetum cinerariifolium]